MKAKIKPQEKPMYRQRTGWKFTTILTVLFLDGGNTGSLGFFLNWDIMDIY